MRHTRDDVSAVIDAATRVLMVRGRPESREAPGPGIGWGARARDGVAVPTRDGQGIHIGLVGTADERPATMTGPSLRVFTGINPGTDVMAQATGAGVRFVTVLHGPSAPEEFRFRLWLGEGLSLDQAPSGGYDVVHDRYGATVGRFTAPWACDALFRPVTATYRLDGSAIVMTIAHRTADPLYPVVADPLYTV